MAIPASAETELVKITLSPQDILNIINQGEYPDREILSFVQCNSGRVDLFPYVDIQNPDTLAPESIFSSPSFDHFIIDNVLYLSFPYLVYPHELSSYSSLFFLKFPFSFYFDETSINSLSFSLFVESNSVSESTLDLLNEGSLVQPVSGYVSSSSVISWSSSPLSSLQSLYPVLSSILPAFNSPYHINIDFNFVPTDSVDQLQFGFVLSDSSSPQLVAFPLLIGISSFDVYVEQEIYPAVEEYLDVIAGPPTAENQQKINQLKHEMQEIDSQLKESAEDMVVDVPDISDVKNDIPEELQQGNELVSDAILRPILDIQPIATILLGTFAILALKLILFGSGPF